MEISKVWELLEGLVKAAVTALPGATGKEKKAWCIDQAVILVEMGDNWIPVLGKWADLPVVDQFERYLIGLGIERAWTALQLPEA